MIRFVELPEPHSTIDAPKGPFQLVYIMVYAKKMGI